MFYVVKRFEVSAAHALTLDYKSQCTNLHGHNWIIKVYCRAEKLNENGMVTDFAVIKNFVHGKMDHHNLNDVFPWMNPTAENIAKWIVDSVPNCYKAEVAESENNVAIYEKI